MVSSLSVLYVGAKEECVRALARSSAAESMSLSWQSPYEQTDRADFGDAQLVVVDGSASAPRGVVEVVQRTRWLGYDGVLLVVGFGASALDRVLATAAGADAVREPPLALEDLIALAASEVHGRGRRPVGVPVALPA